MFFTEPLIFGAKDWNHPYPRITLKTWSPDAPGRLFLGEHLKEPFRRYFDVPNCYTVWLGEQAIDEGVGLGAFVQRFDSLDDAVLGGMPGGTICGPCQKKEGLPCRIKVQEGRRNFSDASLADIARSMVRKAYGESDLKDCGVIQLLLGQNRTAAENRFYTLYLLRALEKSSHGTLSGDGLKHLSTFLTQEATGGEQKEEAWAWTWKYLLADIAYPALIPQVWLNWVPAMPTGEDDPNKRFYQRNPGRVDYVYFPGNRRAVVVEIDGGVHYGDEEAYTRTIRLGRRMKNMGFDVFRLTNTEVLKAKSFEELEQEIGLP